MTISCFLIGADTLLIGCAEILLKRGHDIRGIVTATPRVAEWAETQKIRCVPLDDGYVDALQREAFEYLFAITHLQLIPDAVLALPSRAAINFHDGPLPRYAGLNAPAWALMNREPSYGITWHEMSSGVDEGAVLKQVLFELSPGETSLTLNTRNFEAAIESFGDVIDELDSGRIEPLPQDGSQRTYFGRHQRPRAACLLDWQRPATELDALVRALDFGRYDNPLGLAKVWLGDRCLAVSRAELVDADDHALLAPSGAPSEAGRVLATKDGVTVECGEGALRLSKLTLLTGLEEQGAAASALGVSVGDKLAELPASLTSAIAAEQERLARAESFWERRLAGSEPAELAFKRDPQQETAGRAPSTAKLSWPEGWFQRLGEDGFAAAVAALGLYLGRTSQRNDFVIGYTGPAQETLARQLPGLVSSSVPLRFRWAPEQSFDELFKSVSAELALVEKRGTFWRDLVARKPSLSARHSLADGGFSPVLIHRSQAEDASLDSVPASPLLAIGLAQGGLEIRCSEALGVSAATLRDQLFATLANVLRDLLAPSGSIHLLSEDDLNRVLLQWNQTELPFEPTCVHELFERQAAKTPDRIAVRFGHREVSYAELNARANALAVRLREAGVRPDDVVGVMVDRSLDLLVATLGILKAGGAYLPLDPAYPLERLHFMLTDSGARQVVVQPHHEARLPEGVAGLPVSSSDRARIVDNPAPVATPKHLAYLIYTSGSTGKPKGVMVEHRNVTNFFLAMAEVVPNEEGSVWLSVTSLSFDISVLELFWTLSRGFTVILHESQLERRAAPQVFEKPIDFGLFMWGADDTQSDDKYDLMLHAARFGDEHGFVAVWTPERHFHAFGGPYPNPSVTSAALAAVTSRIQIRGGSCVVPLHHPVRVAEEWAVVDNISRGRVGIAFASGWQPNDFLLRPESFKDNKQVLLDSLDQVRRLWRGEELRFDGPLGKPVAVVSQPRPVQKELPYWVTTAGNPDTFRLAGSLGANLLTHLLGQSVEQLREKIRAYREARAAAGYAPQTGVVSLMLHTYVGVDSATVKERVRSPMKAYLKSSVRLIQGFAWAFPAFKKPAKGGGEEIDVQSLSEEDLDTVLEFAFERYYETSGLFGSPEQCLEMVARVQAIGVDEIACLIDYGVPVDQVKEGLKHLARLQELARARHAAPVEGSDANEDEHSLGALAVRYRATHLQCTPSQLRMALLEPRDREAILGIEHLMIGGEPLPLDLARQVARRGKGTLTNMYGPTETTIWSTTQRIAPDDAKIFIGRPIANTSVYVLDAQLMPVPIGVPGELCIGGAGVVRGYHRRLDLDTERFVDNPFVAGGRLYRTGDRVRFTEDGLLEFIGRTDHQVKVRGHRIELGEIEARLRTHPGVTQAVVVLREDTPGDQRLVAYFTGAATRDELRRHARETLPEFMVPSVLVSLPRLPHTPNGKIDRKALPLPGEAGRGEPTRPTLPESEMELAIAELWREVLGLDDVGVNDNFFELGGHSLLVVRLHQLLKAKLGRELPMTAVYRFPTIRTFVQSIGDDQPTAAIKQGHDRGLARRENLARRRLARARRS